MANPRPVFHASGVEIVDGPRTLKERHLKMTFSQDGRRFRAIAWRAAERADFLNQNRAAVNWPSRSKRTSSRERHISNSPSPISKA